MVDETLVLQIDESINEGDIEPIAKAVHKATPDGINVIAIPKEVNPVSLEELEQFVDSLQEIVESRKENATQSE